MSSQAYIIEIGSDAVGIVVREEGEASFQFHSAIGTFRSLDGKRFATAQAAQRAADDLHGVRKQRASEQNVRQRDQRRHERGLNSGNGALALSLA